MVALGFFCLGPVTAGGLQKVSHSWWSQNRAVKSNFWSHYRTFLPNVGLGLNPTTHSTQCDPAGWISVAIIQFNGYRLCCSTLTLPNTGIFMGWEQARTEFEINKQRTLLLIIVKKKRERVNIQTSTQPGILFMKSLYCQSEPSWEQSAGPVKVRRAAPSLQKQPGGGCKAHSGKSIWEYLSGFARRGSFKTKLVPPQAFTGPVSPVLHGCWEDMEFQGSAPLRRVSGEWNVTVPSIPAAGGVLGSRRCWERLGEAGRCWEKLGDAGRGWERLGDAAGHRCSHEPMPAQRLSRGCSGAGGTGGWHIWGDSNVSFLSRCYYHCQLNWYALSACCQACAGLAQCGLVLHSPWALLEPKCDACRCEQAWEKHRASLTLSKLRTALSVLSEIKTTWQQAFVAVSQRISAAS